MILTARWVLPIASPPIADGAVAIDGAHIRWVGRQVDAPAGERTALGDAVLLPGLVNTHTHLELTAMRGFLEELPFRPWVLRLTQARDAVLSERLLLASAKLGIAEGLLAGITTFADTSPSGLALSAMRALGVRGIVYQEVFGPDPSQCEESLAGLRRSLDRLCADAAAGGGLVRVGVSPHAPYTVSDDLYSATARLAGERGLPLAVHIAESDAEVDFVRDGSGPFAEAWRARGLSVAPRGASPVALLERTGVLSPHTLLIHGVRTDADDVDRIVRYDCPIAHCPASNAKLGHGVAPLGAWLERGVRVGLGSDSVASNNRMDLLDEARTAILLQRARTSSHAALPAAGALDLATRGGARALGLDDRIGTLEAGKEADLAVFSLGGARSTPVHDPATALVWSLAGRPATLVMVAGRVLVRDGRLLQDVEDETSLVLDAAAALAAWSPAGG